MVARDELDDIVAAAQEAYAQAHGGAVDEGGSDGSRTASRGALRSRAWRRLRAAVAWATILRGRPEESERPPAPRTAKDFQVS